MDPTIPKFDEVLKIIKDSHSRQATFSNEAQLKFISFHDELCSRKLAIKDEEDRRGILSKAKGQLARLSMIICVLEQAIEITSQDSVWSYKVDKLSVEKAKIILDYVIEQKFALMEPEIKIVTTIHSDDPNLQTGSDVLDHNPKYLHKFLSFKGNSVLASDVSQFRLMPPSQTTKKNKYPVENCRGYMREFKLLMLALVICIMIVNLQRGRCYFVKDLLMTWVFHNRKLLKK